MCVRTAARLARLFTSSTVDDRDVSCEKGEAECQTYVHAHIVEPLATAPSIGDRVLHPEVHTKLHSGLLLATERRQDLVDTQTNHQHNRQKIVTPEAINYVRVCTRATEVVKE